MLRPPGLGAVIVGALLIAGGCSTSPNVAAPTSSPPRSPTATRSSYSPVPETSGATATATGVDPAFCAAAADYVIAIDAISALRTSDRPTDWVPALKRLSEAGRKLGTSLPTQVPVEVEAALTTQTASLAGLVAEGSSQASPSAEQLRDFDAATVVVADYLTTQCPDVRPPIT